MMTHQHLASCVSLLLVLLRSGLIQGLYLETYPSTFWKIPEDTMHNLTVSLRFNDSSEFGYWDLDEELISGSPLDSPISMLPESTYPKLAIKVVADKVWKLDFVNACVEFTAQEVFQGVNKTIEFSGYYWGLSKLSFYLTRNDLDSDFKNATLLRNDLQIVVDRKLLLLDTIFIGFGVTFMLINNTMMGSQLDLQIILSVLKKPLGPLCGFISQFTLMPLLTFFFGKAFFDDPLERLGLFTLGCCPGGVMSNFWTLMFDGDINLSITMTAVSTIAAMGMMPLWMFTLGKSLLEDNDNLQIPFANLVYSLIGLTIPVGLGILLKHKKPHWAATAQRIIKPVTLIVILFFMILGTYNSYKVFLLMTGPMVAAGFLVSLGGYCLGALFAKIFCLSTDKVIAVSIETAMQNPGVAFMLLKLSLPSPNSDLAALPIMATMMLTGPPVMITYAVFAFLRRCCGCCPKKVTDEKTIAEEVHNAKEAEAFLSDVEASQGKTTDPLIKLPEDDASENSKYLDLVEFSKMSNTIVLEGFTKSSLKRKMSLSEQT